MKRDIVIGVVRAKHDVHYAAGEIRHTVGYHACNGHIVYCDASKKQHLMKEGEYYHEYFSQKCFYLTYDVKFRVQRNRLSLTFPLTVGREYIVKNSSY